MVMRNRHGGANSPGWWDDLPPQVRARFGTLPPVCLADDPVPGGRAARPTALDWVREMSRLALFLLAAAVVNMLLLLLTLSFIAAGPVAVPGR